jgi:uncharacterized SAM-binding protein YcdF (DUF218 family)
MRRNSCSKMVARIEAHSRRAAAGRSALHGRELLWRRRDLPALVAVLVLSGIAAWVERAPLLRTAADLWIVSDPVSSADAVAIFGGGVNDRPFAASAYYQGGLAKKILLSVNRVETAAEPGAVPSDTEANHLVLRKLGIPESAIDTFGTGLLNTHEEALALLAWAQQAGARSIIVPTEIFAARRLRWMLHRAFGDSVTIIVPALEPVEYRRDNWWQSHQGIFAFQNVVLKYIYYRLRY